MVDLLVSKVQGDNIDIKSIFHPAEIKGYIFIEGTIGNVHRAMQGLMHSRGMINKPINIEEIRHFLEYKKTRLRVDKGDIMEIIGGPFKGEKGRIIRVNKIKDEVTAELLEATIPIPVTIATEFVKIIKKSKTSEPEEEKPTEKKEDEKSVFDVDETHEDSKEVAAEKKEESKETTDKAKEEKPEKEQPKDSKEKPVEKPKKRKSFLEELEEEQR